MRIDIDTLSDEHDCETCGGSYATGGIVKVDGREFFRFEPFAYCFDEKSLEPDDLLAIVLDLVGIKVYVDGQNNFERLVLNLVNPESGE
jgi:hypothetical protein